MLTSLEGRVVGCLMEKEATTPDQYPLTVNALVLACNQTSSRDPVMTLAEADVTAAIDMLKLSGWLRRELPSHGRSVVRIRHKVGDLLGVDADGPAVLAVAGVLLLRGPQTVAEIRRLTERWFRFDSANDVEAALSWLQERGHVRLLERQPGQKESRWQQLLADESVPAVAAASGEPAGEPAIVTDVQARLDALESRVAHLEAKLADLL